MPHASNESSNGRNMAELCRRTIDHLNRGYDMPRDALEKEVHLASLVLNELRDSLIKRLRADASAAASLWREPLDQVNRVISLVAGVEFPSSGLHRNYMEESRKTLEKVMESFAGMTEARAVNQKIESRIQEQNKSD